MRFSTAMIFILFTVFMSCDHTGCSNSGCSNDSGCVEGNNSGCSNSGCSNDSGCSSGGNNSGCSKSGCSNDSGCSSSGGNNSGCSRSGCSNDSGENNSGCSRSDKSGGNNSGCSRSGDPGKSSSGSNGKIGSSKGNNSGSNSKIDSKGNGSGANNKIVSDLEGPSDKTNSKSEGGGFGCSRSKGSGKSGGSNFFGCSRSGEKTNISPIEKETIKKSPLKKETAKASKEKISSASKQTSSVSKQASSTSSQKTIASKSAQKNGDSGKSHSLKDISKKEIKQRTYDTVEGALKKVLESPYGLWTLRILGAFVVIAVFIVCWKILQFLWQTDGATILKGIGLMVFTIALMILTLVIGNSNIASFATAFIELVLAIVAGIKFVYKPAKEKIKAKQ